MASSAVHPNALVPSMSGAMVKGVPPSWRRWGASGNELLLATNLKRFERADQICIGIDHRIGAELIHRPVREAEADRDERHARRPRRIRVDDRIADEGRPAAAGT